MTTHNCRSSIWWKCAVVTLVQAVGGTLPGLGQEGVSPEACSSRFAPYSQIHQSSAAAWRKAAQERIEKQRKGDLVIQLVDKKGKAAGNAVVEVRMTRHLFRFGSAIHGTQIEAPEPRDKNEKFARELFL